MSKLGYFHSNFEIMIKFCYSEAYQLDTCSEGCVMAVRKLSILMDENSLGLCREAGGFIWC